MCGIAGAIFWREDADARRAGPVVEAMTAALAHRGPDGAGLVVEQAAGTIAGLGHRRLAIIDLSERGAQPMASVRQPVWITFNGEVYNFGVLRTELEAAGHRFRSQSDTEVVLRGYEAWGAAVVDRLQGMFAFAIYDGRDGSLLLARDRLGIKPLYTFRTAQGLLFASEIRALLASGLVPRRIDRDGLEQYLAYQTVPTPRTLVAGVRLIRPGHIVAVEAGGRVTERRYWDLLGNAAPVDADVSQADAETRVRALLAESVQGHLISDVPVGIFLSGGIDSTALVAEAHALGHRPSTFSVVMPGTAEDESAYARLVADRFRCDHHEIVLTEAELRARVPEALDGVDHPTGDGINTFVVARAVRAAGIKVALSGLGGDELFGGYPSFGRLRRLRASGRIWGQSPAVLRRSAAAAVRSIGGLTVATEKAAAVLERDGSWVQTFPVLRQVFGSRERASLLVEPPSGAAEDGYGPVLRDGLGRHPDRDLMAFVSFAEARTYMHDVLLRDSDQMSMAHGLELRVPLLDHPLVEYVMGLPERVKLPGQTPKRLLVASLGDLMPEAIVRRPKRGFVLPFETWMRGDLRAFCARHLGPEGLGGRGLLRSAAVSALWNGFLAGDGRTTWSRPWTLVALDAWLERNALTL